MSLKINFLVSKLVILLSLRGVSYSNNIYIYTLDKLLLNKSKDCKKVRVC